MSAPLKVELRADATSLNAAVAELTQLLVDAPDSFTERLASIINDHPRKLFEIGPADRDRGSAPRTPGLTVFLDPSDLMKRLLATCRAGEFSLSFFDHESISVGCVEHSQRSGHLGAAKAAPERLGAPKNITP